MRGKTMIDFAGNPNEVAGGFPDHLTSYELLAQHIRGQLDGLNTTQKGDRFAHLVRKLVPQTEVGSDFELPQLSERKSNDEGVDLSAKSKDDNKYLYIQSRLFVDRADTIDSVLSKFQAYKASHQASIVRGQYTLFNEGELPQFLLMTLSPLQGILKAYEGKEFASKDFYRRCIADGRIHFIDGHQIYSILRGAYLKLNQPPVSLELNVVTPVTNKDNVYIGIVSSVELQRLHRQFNDALFFENVRDFKGTTRGAERIGRSTPNDEIVKTVREAPEKMLERNNGIVFRADAIQVSADRKRLALTQGSIINGCQTTMCLVNYSAIPSYVVVKIIEKPSEDSWDVARAANYQNPVSEIDLLLAPSLRPQLAKRAASISGVQLDNGEKSAFQIMDEIYEQTVAYEETRLLFIGIFSRTPNNVLNANYTELLQDLIDRFYKEDPLGTRTFETLFALQGASQEGVDVARGVFKNESYTKMFQRFYRHPTFSYRCFVSILALCGALGVDISKREADPAAEFARMNTFLSDARTLLESDKGRFLRFYTLSVKVWMQEMMPLDAEDIEIQRDMNKQSKSANFTIMFRKLSMEADLDDALRGKGNEGK
jgi:hypothetical protein